MLIKIPQIKSKYIESKSKLLIHKAQNKEDIVDIIPTELHMRTPFYCGSKKMVQQLKKFI